MAKPYPKPVKQEKKKEDGQWVGGRLIQKIGGKKYKKVSSQKYRASTGGLFSQKQIDSRLSKSYSKSKNPHGSHCECCGMVRASDHDHTISQRSCKILKKTELIWDSKNWSLSCRQCHEEWESYKSGLFQKHLNFIPRMVFLKKHDPDGFRKRKMYVTDSKLITELNKDHCRLCSDSIERVSSNPLCLSCQEEKI